MVEIPGVALNTLAGAPSTSDPNDPLTGLTGLPTGPVTAQPLPTSPGAAALANIPQTIPPLPVKQDQPDNAEDMTFGQKVAHAADKLGVPANTPGGWAKSLVGAAQSALAGLSDISSTPVANGGSGIIEGISQTMANRANRQRQAAQDAQKQSQLDKENARQDAAASIAAENATMLHDQQVNSHLEDGRQKSITTGSESIKPYLAANAPVVQKDVDSTEINDLIRKNKLNPAQVHAFATGEKPMGEPDKNGIQQYRTTYTLVGDVPDVTLDEKTSPGMAAYLSKWTKQNIQDGQKLSGLQYGQLSQEANSAETAANALDESRSKAGLAKANEDQLDRIQKMNPDWNISLSATAGKDGLDPIAAIKNVAAIKNPDGSLKYPTATSDAMAAYWGSKDDPSGAKGMDTYLHQRADDAEKAAKDAKEKADKKMEDLNFGDASLFGDPKAYRASMDPAASALVDSIGTGHIALPNLAYIIGRKPEIAAAVSTLYPDFDQSKAAAYPKLYADFTSGKSAATLKAGGIALKHMMRLYNNTDFWSRLASTDVAKASQADYNQLALEVSKVSNGGTAPTKEEIEHAMDSLGGNNWYDLNREGGIKETALLIGDGLKELNNQWDNGAPSKYYEAPVPVPSKEALDAAEYIKNDGKYQVTDPKTGSVWTLPNQEALDKAKTHFGIALPTQSGVKNPPPPLPGKSAAVENGNPQ